MSHEFQKLT